MDKPEQEQKAVRITALVVSHNRADLLRRCIESLERSQDRDTMEIIVVDNGSADGSPQLESEFPGTRFIKLPRNFGLTKALNIGMRAAAGEFILLLHDDTEVSPETAAGLASVLERESDAGAAIPLLVDENDRPAPQVRSLPNPSNAREPWRPADAGRPIEYALGAAIMFRGFYLRALRQIDERYGQYGSDAELCAQVRRSGKKIALVSSARVVHHSAPSKDGLRDADFQLGRAVFLGKRFGFLTGLKARLGAVLGALGATLTFRDIGYNVSRLRFLASGQKMDGTQRHR